MLDRLELTPTKISAISSDILKVVSLKDPIGEEIETIKKTERFNHQENSSSFWCYLCYLRVPT